MLTLVASPFENAFEELFNNIQTDCIICSPYITSAPVRQLVKSRRGATTRRIRIDVLTDISMRNLIQGATELPALLHLFDSGHEVSITYLPGLHAKVYIADSTRALIASANFTEGGARRNFEYGAAVDDAATILKIRSDVNAYKALGAPLAKEELVSLNEQVETLKRTIEAEQRTIRQVIRSNAVEQERRAADALLKVRVRRDSLHTIFVNTILYLLSAGPATTEELYEKIRNIHPDLCDDAIDRVIDGKRFGKRWKHDVRNAQQTLKKSGKIRYEENTGKWRKNEKRPS